MSLSESSLFDPSLSVSCYTPVMPIDERHHVYLVRHRETGKLCVGKTLDIYSLDIYRELQLHPVEGVPRIIASCEERGRLTIIEEFISGSTLRDKIEKTRNSDLSSGDLLTGITICKYMIRLCEILERLHSLDPPMIHRDIKPSNIMITSLDNVVLLDFNAARRYSGRAAQESDTRLLGTQGYAAPEQYGFRESSPQTDLFSVGKVLKEAVASLPAPDHSFDAVIAKCTQMDPSRRYASAGALKAALQKILARCDRQGTAEKAVCPYLPPGFRTLNLWKMLIASLVYLMTAALCFTMEIEKSGGFSLWFQRTGVFVIFLTDILIANDYLGIRRFAPFHRSPNRFLRLVGTLLMMTAVTLILFVIMIFIVGYFLVPN